MELSFIEIVVFVHVACGAETAAFVYSLITIGEIINVVGVALQRSCFSILTLKTLGLLFPNAGVVPQDVDLNVWTNSILSPTR